MWPHYRETVTVVDVLEEGACFDGVAKWLYANDRAIAGPAQDHARKSEHIRKAANSDGSGYGSGYSDGSDGSGYGYGYGSGGHQE